MLEAEVVSACMDEIEIVQMSEHDLLEVVDLEERSGLSRWGWAAYYAELQGPQRTLMFIARRKNRRDDEHIAGYIAARDTAGELHINNVAVDEQYRRKGIGSALLKAVVQQGRQLGSITALLEVRSGNTAALALYQKCGFTAVARRSNYYSEPREDATIMSCPLGQLDA
ncbi:MAG: ribosomal protein S18-alanine N-acetyltransferase [Pyrinomonadaceae bacterium]